jgi:hypothetical protein
LLKSGASTTCAPGGGLVGVDVVAHALNAKRDKAARICRAAAVLVDNRPTARNIGNRHPSLQTDLRTLSKPFYFFAFFSSMYFFISRRRFCRARRRLFLRASSFI